MLATFVTFGLWLVLTCHLYMGVLIPQFSFLFIVMTALAYAVERQIKLEFLKSEENRSMKHEFQDMLETVPEGIVIFDEKDDDRVFIANKDMLNLAL
jgi:PAS domain-containing protein